MAVPHFDPPEQPSIGSGRRKSVLVDRVQLHNGMTQSRRINVRPLDQWALRWDLADEATLEYIDSFIDGLNGSDGPFTWEPWAKISSPTGISLTAEQVAGGALGARTLYFAFTYYDDVSGQESLPSAEQSLAVSANNYLKITRPMPIPNGVPKWRFYVSETSGALKLETTLDDSVASYTLAGAPSGSTNPPTANNLKSATRRFILGSELGQRSVADDLYDLNLTLLESFV